MTALDVSAFVTEESPELTAYKAKVKKIAKRYATENGWCSTVDRALREMGIGTVRKVPVSVDLGWGPIDLRIDASDLHNKTEEQQKATIAKTLGTVYLVVGSARKEIAVTPEMLTDISVTPPPPQQQAAPTGYGWYLHAGNGKTYKSHLYRVDLMDSGDWVESVCRRTSEYPLHLAIDTEHEHCVTCEQRASAMTA